MRRSFLFTLIYFAIFSLVSVPLILNMKINELSKNINELDKEIFILKRLEMQVNLSYKEKFSTSNIDKLAKAHSYERLEINQKVNKLEIPYKLKSKDKGKIAILGFGK